MKARLGVNIDHVATLRQQRGEEYPSVPHAAETSLMAGASQITIHLRSDRRHIQDFDVNQVKEVCDEFKKLLNFEMGTSPDIVAIAIKTKPDWVCLVPEKREERTTEGGLNLSDEKTYNEIEKVMQEIRKDSPLTKISLFIEASSVDLEKSLKLQADAVEIHTGAYAIAFNQEKDVNQFIKQYQQASEFCFQNKIHFHAGHGLTDLSVVPLLELGIFEEYNIGHWIISQAVFDGLGSVVENLNLLIEEYPLKRSFL